MKGHDEQRARKLDRGYRIAMILFPDRRRQRDEVENITRFLRFLLFFSSSSPAQNANNRNRSQPLNAKYHNS